MSWLEELVREVFIVNSLQIYIFFQMDHGGFVEDLPWGHNNSSE